MNTANVSSDYRPKYVYLLAYASCVGEVNRNGIRIVSVNGKSTQNHLQQTKMELDFYRNRIEELLDRLEKSDDLALILPDVLKLIKLPILASAMLNYVESIIFRDEFTAEPQTVHLVLIDSIGGQHPNLRHA